MLPTQYPKTYLAGTQRVHDLLVQLNATLRDAYRDFWADPPSQAAPLNLQARAAGMTAAAVFAMHHQIILSLAVIIPDRLAWIAAGPPIPVPFAADGDIDAAALTTAWAAYLSTLPQPEPEEESP